LTAGGRWGWAGLVRQRVDRAGDSVVEDGAEENGVARGRSGMRREKGSHDPLTHDGSSHIRGTL
jgi:hypothetical protein